MIDEIKRRTIIDISPDDVGKSYTDSTFNAASPTLGTITGQDTATFGDNVTFHPGSGGVRTSPNEAGFAFSDTPEATVFIQKREWIEDDWTYVTNSKERSGKIEELLLRIRIGNIITRKLDWLNDHELFTKVSKLNSLITTNALELSGSQVTRYYTETLDLSEKTTTVTQQKKDKEEFISIATSVRVNTQDSGEGGRLLIRSSPDGGEIITAVHGPNTGGPTTITISTTGKGKNESKIQNVINGQNSVDEGVVSLDYPESAKTNPQILEKYQSAEWWEIDLSSIPLEAFFPAANRDSILKNMPNKNSASQAEMQSYIFNAIKGGFNNGIGYVRRVPQGRTPPRQLAKSFGEPIKVTILNESETTAKPINPINTKRVFNNVFNGVIELANIASINTNISNTGSAGSAQLVLQNPNNILAISDEDIDIALGENPFLDGTRDEFGQSKEDITTTDPITGETRSFKYYRGRYYTDRAYQLVTRQDLGAIGNFTNNKQIEELKGVVNVLSTGIRELQQFASSGRLTINTWEYLLATDIQELAPTDSQAVKQAVNWSAISISKAFIVSIGVDQGASDQPLGTYARYREVGPQVNSKIQNFANVILVAQKEIENLINAGNLAVKNKDTAQEALIRNQIKKYFQNRTIFQVLDRVYVWMTSPARTEHTLENGTPVSEEFTIGANKARRVQEIVSLIQQLENIIQTIAAQLQQPLNPVFSAQDISIINQQLYDAGSSAQLTKILDQVTKAFSGETFSNAILGAFIEAQNFIINPLGFESTLSTSAKRPPMLAILMDTIMQRVKELGEAMKQTEQTLSLPGSSDTSVQGVDPSKLFAPNSYLGLTERQFQVFQGVITRISRSFSNGTFTVRLDCADNLYFLKRSRYIEVPGLNVFANRALAVLDDPIWRQRDAFAVQTLPIAGSNEPVESFFGKWKTGLLTLSASILPEKEGLESTLDAGQKKEATNTANVQKADVISRAFGRSPQAENEPFEGADPAQIISVLTCGVPFDITTYLENTIFKGSLKVEPKLKSSPETPHSGEVLEVGPFEQVRQEVAPLAKKFGNFQPYLNSETSVTQEDKNTTNLATKKNLATAVMQFYKTYIAARKSVLAADVEKDKQKTNTPGSPFKEITDANVDQVIPGDFPAATDQIKLGDFEGQIDRKVVYIIMSAIRQLTPERINKVMSTGGFVAEEFKLGTEDYSSVYQQAPNRAIFALSSGEIGLYAAISQASGDRVGRGAVFRLLLDKEVPKKSYTTPQSPSLEELVGSNMANPSATSLKAKRDARLHPTNILQSTKESIIYKVKPNFLVVSDKYFLNDQLVDYVRQIGNPGASFNDNQYATVLDRCVKAAQTIDWEFYADSQGHLQFKPPTYNRTLLHHLIDFNDIDPVYAKTITEILKRYKALDSLKAVPLALYKQAFLAVKNTHKDIIRNQLDTCAALKLRTGPGDLFSVTNLLGIGSAEPTSLIQLVISDHLDDGRLQEVAALLQSPPETVVTIEPRSNPFQSQIETDLNTKKITEALDQITSVIQSGGVVPAGPEQAQSLAMAIMTQQLATFAKEQSDYYAPSNQGENASDSENASLAQAAAEVIEVAINIIVQAQLNINVINEQIAQLEKEIDPVLKSFTDPDKVHVITAAITLSEDWEESEPDFTRLNVTSAFAFAGANQSDGVAGQYLHWAGSVDYDLWRIYGYKVHNQNLPFLQTAQQAAVYGDILMARQYAKILRGTVSVRGDSKYQIGDCVYVEDENLYYYITAVTHQFSYGQGFTTSLTLEYGRRPGYYIPYPFDLLGKEFTRGANILYTGPSGDKTSSAADLNNLFDIAWQKDEAERKKNSEYNN